MKTLAVAFLLVLLVFACQRLSQAMTDEEASAIALKFVDQCIKEGGLSADESKLILDEKTDIISVKNVSDKVKCYMLCFYKKLGLVDASGKVNNEKLLKFMEGRHEQKKAKVKPALAKCVSIKDANPCEITYKFELCMEESMRA